MICIKTFFKYIVQCVYVSRVNVIVFHFSNLFMPFNRPIPLPVHAIHINCVLKSFRFVLWRNSAPFYLHLIDCLSNKQWFVLPNIVFLLLEENSRSWFWKFIFCCFQHNVIDMSLFQLYNSTQTCYRRLYYQVNVLKQC